ncbi:SWI/SNF chromatin-remodeling complex subunit [Ceratobasidium sp. 428]|nr:SWI/SNF chromatin-remodeling complex subunit [Ceratobasidium sp. 428]
MHDVNVIFAVAYNSAVPTRPVLLEAKSSHHKKWWRLLQTCWDRRPYMRPKASAWEALRRDTDQPASQNASPELQTSSLPKMDEVLPPQWMSDCLDTLQMTHPADRFTIIVKTDPQNAEEPPLPKFRLKCLDCPGKLYTPGPEQSLANFVVHLKNRTHRSRVNSRLAVETAALVTETATAPAVTSPD